MPKKKESWRDKTVFGKIAKGLKEDTKRSDKAKKKPKKSRAPHSGGSAGPRGRSGY